MEHARVWLLLAAILGGLGVTLGAFGAHWLPRHLTAGGVTAEELVKRAANWETAARYQMYHALAMLAVAWLATTAVRSQATWAGILFTAGVVIFSGCLYALVLSGEKTLGRIVPVGGAFLIAGWISLAIAALRLR